MGVTLSSSDVLFVSRGNTVVAWYRMGMPSLHLGCDWIGVVGHPPDLALAGSLKRGGTLEIPDFADYKIVILQQVAGREWFREIVRLKEKGVRVYYEVDDYLHAVRKVKGHAGARGFSKKQLEKFEMCMRACTGMIVSTPWLAQRYLKFNRNMFLCRNSIERGRYEKLTLPKRDTVNIGWAGGEGHQESSLQWVPAVRDVAATYEEVRFVSIGLPVASQLGIEGRALAVPFVAIEQFPAALCNFDISIAPAMESNFFAAKSDLRFLECGALGIPCVAHPFVYGESIDDTVTGLLAESLEDVVEDLEHLVADAKLRKMIGDAAREYVLNERSIEKGIEQWERVFMSTEGVK